MHEAGALSLLTITGLVCLAPGSSPTPPHSHGATAESPGRSVVLGPLGAAEACAGLALPAEPPVVGWRGWEHRAPIEFNGGCYLITPIHGAFGADAPPPR